jgi:hypothetical protein
VWEPGSEPLAPGNLQGERHRRIRCAHPGTVSCVRSHGGAAPSPWACLERRSPGRRRCVSPGQTSQRWRLHSALPHLHRCECAHRPSSARIPSRVAALPLGEAGCLPQQVPQPQRGWLPLQPSLDAQFEAKLGARYSKVERA